MKSEEPEHTSRQRAINEMRGMILIITRSDSLYDKRIFTQIEGFFKIYRLWVSKVKKFGLMHLRPIKEHYSLLHSCKGKTGKLPYGPFFFFWEFHAWEKE